MIDDTRLKLIKDFFLNEKNIDVAKNDEVTIERQRFLR